MALSISRMRCGKTTLKYLPVIAPQKRSILQYVASLDLRWPINRNCRVVETVVLANCVYYSPSCVFFVFLQIPGEKERPNLSAPKSRDSLRLRRRQAPRCAISSAKKIASEPRFSSAKKMGKHDPRCGIPCDTLVCGRNR